MKHRHRGRRLAMQALCCLDAQGEKAMDLAVDFIRDSRDTPEACALAERMLEGAWRCRERADAEIAARSRHWDVHRMPVVDRNILRLAFWELDTQHAPPAAVIDEALRLAKEFSTAESPRFINAILDAIVRAASEGDRAGAEVDGSSDGPV